MDGHSELRVPGLKVPGLAQTIGLSHKLAFMGQLLCVQKFTNMTSKQTQNDSLVVTGLKRTQGLRDSSTFPGVISSP